MLTINAADFKAKCLAILDDVARTKRPVTILKRGKPVAELVPIRPSKSQFAQYDLKGTVEFSGNVVGPALPAEVWEAEERTRK